MILNIIPYNYSSSSCNGSRKTDWLLQLWLQSSDCRKRLLFHDSLYCRWQFTLLCLCLTFYSHSVCTVYSNAQLKQGLSSSSRNRKLHGHCCNVIFRYNFMLYFSPPMWIKLILLQHFISILCLKPNIQHNLKYFLHITYYLVNHPTKMRTAGF